MSTVNSVNTIGVTQPPESDAAGKRIAHLERALHQIKNGCVDDGDEANQLFQASPSEIRKIARDALDGIGDFAETIECPRGLVVLAFPGTVCCSLCTLPLTSQPRKAGETHAICWCPSASCEMHDVRLVLEAVQLPVRRFGAENNAA